MRKRGKKPRLERGTADRARAEGELRSESMRSKVVCKCGRLKIPGERLCYFCKMKDGDLVKLAFEWLVARCRGEIS